MALETRSPCTRTLEKGGNERHGRRRTTRECLSDCVEQKSEANEKNEKLKQKSSCTIPSPLGCTHRAKTASVSRQGLHASCKLHAGATTRYQPDYIPFARRTVHSPTARTVHPSSQGRGRSTMDLPEGGREETGNILSQSLHARAPFKHPVIPSSDTLNLDLGISCDRGETPLYCSDPLSIERFTNSCDCRTCSHCHLRGFLQKTCDLAGRCFASPTLCSTTPTHRQSHLCQVPTFLNADSTRPRLSVPLFSLLAPSRNVKRAIVTTDTYGKTYRATLSKHHRARASFVCEWQPSPAVVVVGSFFFPSPLALVACLLKLRGICRATGEEDQ
jgi:hypothetical protein